LRCGGGGGRELVRVICLRLAHVARRKQHHGRPRTRSPAHHQLAHTAHKTEIASERSLSRRTEREREILFMTHDYGVNSGRLRTTDGGNAELGQGDDIGRALMEI